MFARPKPFPAELRRDGAAVEPKHEAPISQIAKDFRISEQPCITGLKKPTLKTARPGVTQKEAAERSQRIWSVFAQAA